MTKLVLTVITLYLVGRYLLPRDWTRIRDIWIHGVTYSIVPCLIFASNIFASLNSHEFYIGSMIGLLFGLVWSYLIYRYEKQLLPVGFSFKKTKIPQIIVWSVVFICIKIFRVNDSVMLLAIIIYTIVGLLGTIYLERSLNKEIHIPAETV